jgi:hypothetical protein
MKHRNKIHQTSFTRFKQGTNARGKVQKRHHKWNTEATHAPINPAARDMEVDAAHVLASGTLSTVSFLANGYTGWARKSYNSSCC